MSKLVKSCSWICLRFVLHICLHCRKQKRTIFGFQLFGYTQPGGPDSRHFSSHNSQGITDTKEQSRSVASAGCFVVEPSTLAQWLSLPSRFWELPLRFPADKPTLSHGKLTNNNIFHSLFTSTAFATIQYVTPCRRMGYKHTNKQTHKQTNTQTNKQTNKPR